MNTSSNSVKRILIDTTFLFDQYAFRGIGRTGKEIVFRLIPKLLEEEFEIHLAGFKTLEKNLIELGFSQFSIEEITPRIAFTSFGEPVPSGIRNIHRWGQFFKPLIEDLRPDIFFATHFERGLPTVDRFKKQLNYVPKTAVVCHDVIPLKTNRYTNKDVFRNNIKKYLYNLMWSGVKNADLIFTISQFSKNEIASIPGVDASKIKVIYWGISEDFYKSSIEMEYDNELVDQVLEFYQLKDQTYFYYDSGIESNKGIFELLNLFAKLKGSSNSKIPSKLVLTGGDFYRGEGSNIKAKNNAAQVVLKKANSLGILDNLITTDRISHRDLLILLSNSKFYINLSRYEGFGLGIAQAFATEVPVIASNMSCYPEISQGAALLIDINNISKASEEIIKFIEDDKLVSSNIVKGRKVVETYDWEKTANEYFNSINDLLAKSVN